MNLLKFKLIRKLLQPNTYVKVGNNWINYKNYTNGKVTDVDGIWYNQIFCSCGNILSHSKSYISEDDNGVAYYECTNCSEKQHWNLDIMPGAIKCDENGNPL